MSILLTPTQGPRNFDINAPGRAHHRDPNAHQITSPTVRRTLADIMDAAEGAAAAPVTQNETTLLANQCLNQMFQSLLQGVTAYSLQGKVSSNG